MILDAMNEVSNPGGFRPMDDVIGIALHHSVTTISPLASEEEERAHIRAIDAYHKGQGWGGFGYHYAVFPSARVYRTGVGSRAHVASRNHELAGIVWIADLSNRLPNMYEIAAAAEAIVDVRKRTGKDVPFKGHRFWALPEYPTSCPGRGAEVTTALERAIKEEQTVPDIDLLKQRVDALSVQLERLERLLCTNGGELTVVADAANASTLGNLVGRDVRIGDRVTLKGEQIPVYLDRMGNNMWLGLAMAQEAAMRANAAAEMLKAQQPRAAGDAVEELRLLRFADGSVRLIK